MQFWVDWAIWQKLCFVLVIILALVLAFSFGVLIYNRRSLKKHAAAEECEKAANDAELRPMLTRSSDIPFGARALERGVQIEGIWISSNETVNQIPREFSQVKRPSTPTPIVGSPLKQTAFVNGSETQEPMPQYPSASITTPSKALNGNSTGDDWAMSVHSIERCASLHSIRTAATHLEPQRSHDPGVRHSKQWFGPRSSWITKGPAAYKRGSRSSEDTRRQSSEEIRRRFSRLFDEQLKARPLEAFQLGPVPPTRESDKKGLRPPQS